ncbi:MAG: hypothetical protein FJX74_18700 [Armatimonadetes bacterium]|nr:hypothetical protein [Armatimonadota bacterium]
MPSDPAVPTHDIAEAWRRLDPVKPLSSGSPWYVDCSAERGIHRFLDRMEQAVTWSMTGEQGGPFVHDLVVGHRGSGKSTELLRLQTRLQEKGFYVHYIDMAEELEPDDIDCEAVLTVVLRRLVPDLETLGINLDARLLTQIADWFGDRVKTVVGSKSAQVGLDVEAGLGSSNPLVTLLAKFTGYMRWGTDTRDTLTLQYRRYLSELRLQVEPLFVEADLLLRQRPESPQGLFVIVDSLDHIRLPSRQDEVFIGSADLLCQLPVHFVLTTPPALFSAGRGSEVESTFSHCRWLPAVKVRTLAGDPFPDGEQRMRDIIGARCELSLFEEEALERLCRYSGGHVRHLVRLAREALHAAGAPPVMLDSANRAVAGLSNTLATGRTPDEWATLAQAERNPLGRPFSAEGRNLLFQDCLLTHEDAEEADDECIPSQWYAVHPCLRRLQPFKDALAREVQ